MTQFCTILKNDLQFGFFFDLLRVSLKQQKLQNILSHDFGKVSAFLCQARRSKEGSKLMRYMEELDTDGGYGEDMSDGFLQKFLNELRSVQSLV
ncbi:hypothetical protein ACHAPV_002298 [Trichoderma viride]